MYWYFYPGIRVLARVQLYWYVYPLVPIPMVPIFGTRYNSIESALKNSTSQGIGIFTMHWYFYPGIRVLARVLVCWPIGTHTHGTHF